MKLYVIRHAAAIESDTAVRDEDRWLTPAGRKVFRKNARRLAGKGVAPECIITSPLARAVQTAEILAAAIDFQGEILVSREMAPGFDVEGLLRLIAANGMPHSLVIVGHEPDLGALAGRLLGRKEALPLGKGDIVALKFAPAKREAPACFRWLIHRGDITRDLPGSAVARLN